MLVVGVSVGGLADRALKYIPITYSTGDGGPDRLLVHHTAVVHDFILCQIPTILVL